MELLQNCRNICVCVPACVYPSTDVYEFRCESHRYSTNLSLESSHVSCSACRPVLLSRASVLICMWGFPSVCQGCERTGHQQKHAQKGTALHAPVLQESRELRSLGSSPEPGQGCCTSRGLGMRMHRAPVPAPSSPSIPTPSRNSPG